MIIVITMSLIYTLNQQGEQAGSSGIIAKELHPRLPTSRYLFSISSPAPHHSILICREKVNKGKKKKKKKSSESQSHDFLFRF